MKKARNEGYDSRYDQRYEDSRDFGEDDGIDWKGSQRVPLYYYDDDYLEVVDMA